ncbi:MAG: hypothetical protein ACRDA3_14600 [Peptostreptococcaceae bacterium]
MNNNLKNTFPDTPNNFKKRVRATLNSLPEKEECIKMERKIYKNGSFKKKLVVGLAATFVLGTTAFAVGKLSSIVGSTSNIPTYRNMPSIEVVNKDFGFEPKLVDEFENGYKFKSGHTSNNEGFDEDGNSYGKSKALTMFYKKNKCEISITVEDMTLVAESENAVIAGNYNNTDIYYTSYINKFVPVDYEMTEQDKKDEASGKYVFSVGSREVETSEIQHIGFKLDGLYYSILGMDSDLKQEDLVKMAQEIIDVK